MEHGVVWTYLSLFKTAWIYIASGALRDVMKLRKGPVIAALYPVGFFDCATGFCDFVRCGPILSCLVRTSRFPQVRGSVPVQGSR